MKKLLSVLAVFILCIGMTQCAALAEERHVMASFYPIYIFAMNVFDGIENIRLDSMAAPGTGCLHDYQLLAGDMIKLSQADALIVCGAGMEAYLPDVQAQFPEMPVIDCSKDIELIAENEDEADAEYNAHTWLDPQNAIRITRTIAEEAMRLFPEDAEAIHRNADAYIARLQTLDDTLKEMLAPVAGRKIVTFHEAFPYFAKAYGLEIAAVINEEHEDTLSPAQIVKVVAAVREAGNPPLFTEPQYSSDAAFAVAAETGAAIYALDPLASGELEKDAYEKGMLANAEMLLKALE